jgi:PAS domain S-box-containing protein
LTRVFDRTLTGGIALVVLLIIGNVALAYRNAQRVAGTAERVNHTQQVLTELDHVLTSVTEAESAERGFIITENERYIAPFAEAERDIASGFDTLMALTLDNPDAQARLPVIRGYAEKRIALLHLALNVMRTEGAVVARSIVQSDSGRILMDSIRAGLATIHSSERGLLAQRLAIYEENRRFALGSNIVGGIIALAVVTVLVGLLGRDMRLRAEVAAALFDQKELFRTTLASIGDAVIATDTNGRIIFVNGVATSLTGWTLKDAAGLPLDDVFRVINESSRAPVENPALRALRDGAIVGLANHSILIARDGSETPIDDSAAPIRDAEGQTSGAVLVFRNIAERRKAERALRDADRHKDEFLAILAHELRNPLAPLRNAVELMQQTPHDPVALERVRGMMDRQLEQLVRLTDDLLDVSRITRNKLEMHRERVDVIGILQSAIETCGPLLAQQQHTLIQDVPSTPLWVDGDRARLAQVFYNLIGNAAKYTDKGGEIRVNARREEDQIRVEIIDSGIGIAPEMLDRIFDLFTQADRSVSRAQGGLGIGLTLVRRILEAHGGRVTGQSEGRGHGSRFVVHLPALTTAEPAPAPRVVSSRRDGVGPTHARRIIVADDNRDAADTTAMMLRALGHEVRACYDGRQALDEGASFLPDTILLDIGMPGLSGYEVARRVRDEPWGADVTLIALTGWGQTEDRMRSLDAGFDHHLVKPVHLNDLRSVIEAGRGTARPA